MPGGAVTGCPDARFLGSARNDVWGGNYGRGWGEIGR